MPQMKSKWIQIITLVWKSKWEAILALVGLVVSMVAGGLPTWLWGLLAGLMVVLVVDLVWAVRSTIRVVWEKQVPIVAVVGKNDYGLRATINDVWGVMTPLGFDERQFKQEWHVEREDLVLYRADPLPQQAQEWHDLVTQFEYQLTRLNAKLEGRRVFHLFLNCPAALAVGMGALTGSRRELVLHHFQPGGSRSEGSYIPVIDLSTGAASSLFSTQRLRESVTTPYHYIEVIKPDGTLTPEIFVSLHLSGYDPLEPVNKLAAEQNLSAVHVRNTFQNQLPLEANWLRLAREVVTELLTLVSNRRERIHLCLVSPVPLAFAIGMGLGKHIPITVYHWFAAEQRYRPVLALEQVGGLLVAEQPTRQLTLKEAV